MKNIRKLLLSFLVVLCIGMLGAWTTVYPASIEDRYADVFTYSPYSTETITFDSKNNDLKYNRGPQYYAVNGLTNACGAVAGSEIIAFYDKYYPNMIPNWQSFFPASGKYRSQDNVYVPNLMNELYTLMRTNVDDVGVSDSDFTGGLKQYINGKGYNVGFQEVVSGSSIDYSACKTAIDNNKVIALLSREVDVYILQEGSSSDSITTYRVAGLHIMVASGYQEINYYRNGALYRTDKYLIVSTGFNGVQAAHYKINPHCLNSAFIVNIV